MQTADLLQFPPPCEKSKVQVIERLDAIQALPFSKNLTAASNNIGGLKLDPHNSSAIVEALLATRTESNINLWIYAIRNAINDAGKKAGDWQAQWQAASALYYIAVRQLVGLPSQGEGSNARVQRIKILPLGDSTQESKGIAETLGAIIAAALLGGRLDYHGIGRDRTPEHVHMLYIPPDGDAIETAIDRAMYTAWFPNHASASVVTQGSGELTNLQLGELTRQIRLAREGANKTVAFVAEGASFSIEALGKSAEKFSTHIFWQTSQMTEEIMGMNSTELLEDIRSFWDLDNQTLQQPTSLNATQETANMNASTVKIEINNHGGAPVNAVGNNNTINQQVMQTGIDAAALAPLLAALSTAISGVQNTTAKAGLTSDLAELDAAVKSKTPDKSKITAMLNRFKEAPKYIEATQAVADAAVKLYNYVVPMLSTAPTTLSA